MMKVVHFGKYYPPEWGGIETVTRALADSAAEAAFDVTVVCFTKKAMADRPGAVTGSARIVRCLAAWHLSSQPLSWRYAWAAWQAGRRADVVHLHVPNMVAALIGVLLPRRGARLLVHWHSDVIGKGWMGRLFRPLESALLSRADVVVCTSQPYAQASPLLSKVAHKLRVVPIGIAEPAPPSPHALPAWLSDKIRGRQVIMSVGRLVPYKGFEVLVRAARALPAGAVAVIVGEGPGRAGLAQLIAALGLEDRVILAGHLPHDALMGLYRQATLFCLPSVERSEAFGVVLVEAMAHGLPVVATSIAGSGVPWVNAHQVSGLNVPPEQPHALAEACALLLDDEGLRQRLAQGARQRYLEVFTEAAMSRAFLKIYAGISRA